MHTITTIIGSVTLFNAGHAEAGLAFSWATDRDSMSVYLVDVEDCSADSLLCTVRIGQAQDVPTITPAQHFEAAALSFAALWTSAGASA